MKAVDFDYQRPADLAETCALLSEGGGDAKIIAGGQTLVPLLAMRLARPALLIDINRVAELQGIAESGGAVEIRACTRQARALKRRKKSSASWAIAAKWRIPVRWVAEGLLEPGCQGTNLPRGA